jgi:hypothetical protein
MELYMALDGGSGSDFVLPHMSAKAWELPSKAIASFHTVPMKVMNCLVHGDTRSHVVMSPGTILAGASLTCECIAVVLNTSFQEHGQLPMKATVQMDNASVNHNNLVVAFMALYVGLPRFGTATAVHGAVTVGKRGAANTRGGMIGRFSSGSSGRLASGLSLRTTRMTFTMRSTPSTLAP